MIDRVFWMAILICSCQGRKPFKKSFFLTITIFKLFRHCTLSLNSPCTLVTCLEQVWTWVTHLQTRDSSKLSPEPRLAPARFDCRGLAELSWGPPKPTNGSPVRPILSKVYSSSVLLGRATFPLYSPILPWVRTAQLVHQELKLLHPASGLLRVIGIHLHAQEFRQQQADSPGWELNKGILRPGGWNNAVWLLLEHCPQAQRPKRRKENDDNNFMERLLTFTRFEWFCKNCDEGNSSRAAPLD